MSDQPYAISTVRLASEIFLTRLQVLCFSSETRQLKPSRLGISGCHRPSFHPDREAGSLDINLVGVFPLAELFDELHQRLGGVQIFVRLAVVRQGVDVVIAGEEVQDQTPRRTG